MSSILASIELAFLRKESMLPRAWKRFSVEIEGREVDDVVEEVED
jgi:hypothetical protein